MLTVIEQEQELNCDLIVIGKQGHRVTDNLLLGSVTNRVLNESNSDALVSTTRPI